MPPLPPISQVAKLTFLYDNSPVGAPISRAANVLHLQYPPGFSPTLANLVTMANGGMTWWIAHFKPSIASGWLLQQVSAVWLDGSGAQGNSTSAASAGSGTGAPLPPNCAVCISWLGAPALRGGKPRTYLPGVPSSASSTGSANLTGSYCTTLRTAAEAARLDMAAFTVASATPALGTVSYYNRTINPTPPHLRPTPLFYSYSGCKVHQRVDSQRRRTGKEAGFGIS